MGIVKIRISGERADLEALLGFLLDTQAVKKFPQFLSKSIYYPNRNRNDPGLHRYLNFLIESDPEVTPIPSDSPEQ